MPRLWPCTACLTARGWLRTKPKPLSLRASEYYFVDEKTRRQQVEGQLLVEASIERHLAYLSQELSLLDEAIEALIAGSEELSEKQQLLTSCPGVGDKTAWALLGFLPELGQLNRKAIGALAGLAPFQQQSGQWRGKACIRGGRSTVRKALYMAALSATRHCPPIAKFYQHLLDQGKPKKVALVASMHKLLRILNQMLATKSHFILDT